VVKGLLEDLVDRGLDLKRRYLVVMDGSKALRAGVERVFGEQVEVQRCQIHKRRNVKEYLPENCQKDYDRRMRNAYAMNNYAEAKEALNLPATGTDQSNRCPEPGGNHVVSPGFMTMSAPPTRVSRPHCHGERTRQL
jgi:putative transposase